MPLAPLKTALDLAAARNTFAVGFVCLGWEDAQAYVAAGEAAGAPVILSAGPGARAHMPVNIWSEMFRTLASSVDVPVVAHLDHGRSEEDCMQALDAGFSSVMFDGSALPLDQNIAISQRVSKAALQAGAGFEAELGVVGYAEGEKSAATSVQDVTQFLENVELDALAVSVGNVHLMMSQAAHIDWAAAKAISTATKTPLVIHGGSGVKWSDRLRLSKECNVRKFNLGTEFRQRYGQGLREALEQSPNEFDRIKLSEPPREAMCELAIATLRQAGWTR